MAYDYTELTPDFVYYGSRNDIRMQVVLEFSKEQAGEGRENNATRYRYYVETLSSGDRVYLTRPANLHNGFDFLISVENANYAEPGRPVRNSPKHDDIRNDLLKKKKEDPVKYKKLYNILKSIYECKDVDDSELRKIAFSSGLPVDHIVKVVKWFFIEQDIRYWNYSGREMTWSIVPPV